MPPPTLILFRTSARRLKNNKYYFCTVSGESYPDVNLRIRSFLTTLVREYSKKNILVVSHSAILLCFRKLLDKLTERQILEINKTDDIKSCAIIGYRLAPTLKPKPKLRLDLYNKIAW